MKSFLRFWCPVLLYGAIIFIQSAYPTPGAVPRFPFADKVIHAFVYAGLGALFVRAFTHHLPPITYGKLALLLGFAGAVLYGALDEWHQSFVAARVAEAADFIADMLGSALGAFFYWLLRASPLLKNTR
jgi:VanZ family protein